MKRYLTFIFFTCLSLYSLYSQDQGPAGTRIVFHGLVMDARTQDPLSGSQIFIDRTFSSATDVEGKFAFYVFRKDTVIFKMLGYKPATMYISDTLSGNEFIAGIYMHADTIAIDEVVIVPRLASLRSSLYNSHSETSQQMENAKYNLEISAYQGRVTTGKLGDPYSNYNMIREKHKQDAYEKGGIPSDHIVGISPLLLIPAAYLLMNGLPERPDAPKPQLTKQEVEQLNKKYLDQYRKKR